jgi:2-dehydro-3-deoxyglucarate aldolase
MLETETALSNLEDILSVPELGFVKIGAGDLSVSLGHPQEYENPTVQDAIEKIERACSKHTVPLGRGVSSVESAQKALDNGYTLVDIGGDVEVLRSTIDKRVGELQGMMDNDS